MFIVHFYGMNFQVFWSFETVELIHKSEDSSVEGCARGHEGLYSFFLLFLKNRLSECSVVFLLFFFFFFFFFFFSNSSFPKHSCFRLFHVIRTLYLTAEF